MKKKLIAIGTVLLTLSTLAMPASTVFAAELENEATEIEATATDEEATLEEAIDVEAEAVTPLEEIIVEPVETEGSAIEPRWLFEKKYKVTGNNVNIRTGPGTGYASVGKLYKNDIVWVKSIDNGWAKFTYNGQTRYISSTYVKAA